MFCPNCGANNSTEQKFCRSCGLNLEKSVESLFEQTSITQNPKILNRNQLIEKFGSFALGSLGIVVLVAVGAIVYTILTKMILTGANVWAGILLIAFLIFAALSLVFVFLNESNKDKKTKLDSARINELTVAKDTGKFLEETSFKPISSVTENSTELLPAKQTLKIK
jgi:uncharacterized membrane protein YvbJ